MIYIVAGGGNQQDVVVAFENESTFWKWKYILKMKAHFEKTDSVDSSQLSGVRSWLQSSGYGKKEQDMS